VSDHKGAVVEASRLIGALGYPAVMTAAIGVYWLTPSLGPARPLLAVGVAAALVIALERSAPYRADWGADMDQRRIDVAYMIWIHALLPLALAWLTVHALQSAAVDREWTLDVWPAHWPIPAQVLLKLALGDLLRYGLHRACHRIQPLWRLHAVHHQPTRMNATTVFRFHPLEKTLQFCADSLPFILLGVGPEVLAAYFVVYAASGLLQHANCDLKLGPFKRLVTGPETHRLHHDRRLAVADANYAHTFALWDVLFGTFRGEPPAGGLRIGIEYHAGSERFLAQMAAPFRPERPA
jgi:ornithine lipid hydroxylase